MRWRRALPAVLAAAVSAVGSAGAATVPGGGPCSRDRELRTGRSTGPYYSTVAPFEHFSSSRTQVFPSTCSLRELAGPGAIRILTRAAPSNYDTPYVAATRDRDQLYVYGYGADAAREGGYVASVDPRTLRQRWRTRIPDRSPAGQWSYPGVLAVHGNGFLYAVYGNVIVKLDPRSGTVLARRELPEDPRLTGAAYNGMIVLPDGRIATKKIERGPCPGALDPPNPRASVGALAGLSCAVRNALPSRIVIVEPNRLRVISQVTPPEPVTGRITFGRSDGRAYVYAAGRDNLFRYRYRQGRLALDRSWGPVRYRTGGERPGTGPGLLGDFLVVQTNFLPAGEPLTVTAVSVHDSRRVFRARPFARSGAGSSWIVSKPALDAANGIVVTHDTSAGQMAALHLDPRRGFTVRWRRALSSLSFSALVGGAANRQIVIPDLTPRRRRGGLARRAQRQRAGPHGAAGLVGGAGEHRHARLPRPLLLRVGRGQAVGAQAGGSGLNRTES